MHHWSTACVTVKCFGTRFWWQGGKIIGFRESVFGVDGGALSRQIIRWKFEIPLHNDWSLTPMPLQKAEVVATRSGSAIYIYCDSVFGEKGNLWSALGAVLRVAPHCNGRLITSCHMCGPRSCFFPVNTSPPHADFCSDKSLIKSKLGKLIFKVSKRNQIWAFSVKNSLPPARNRIASGLVYQ